MRKSNHLALPQLLIALLLSTMSFSQELQVHDLSDAVPGNLQTQKYLPLLAKKRVAVLTNASGIIANTSLVDSLLKLGVKVKKVFVPEHGFRGEADAGEAAGGAVDRRVDADQPAGAVEQRPARIAGIDRGVGLDEEAVIGDAFGRARYRGHDPRRHGLAHAERIADGEHQIAHFNIVGVAQLEIGQPLAARKRESCPSCVGVASKDSEND